MSETNIYDHADCPRCGSKAGVLCVVIDSSDPSDSHPHSDRIHEFMENGPLVARAHVELENWEALKKGGYTGPIEYGFFATEDEILSVLKQDMLTRKWLLSSPAERSRQSGFKCK